MADDRVIRIHFFCEATDEELPAAPMDKYVLKQLVQPALPEGFQYQLNDGDFHSEPGSLDHYTIDMMAEFELVIADLTELSETAFFLLGARTHKGLPIVYICQTTFPLPYALDNNVGVVRYEIENPAESINYLSEQIAAALAENRKPKSLRPRMPRRQLAPREARLELARRIESTAEVIGLLRINSLGDTVAELVQISQDLKNVADDSNNSVLQEASERALKVLFAILDELSSVPGARMAITGAVSLIVGGSGASSVTAFSAGLAFWFGKDIFAKFISTWGKRGSPPTKKSEAKSKSREK
jgi:hypothetical protein